MMFFDPRYLLFVGPALALAAWAQYRVRTTYAAAQQIPSQLSGAAAARYVLNQAGLTDVAIEQIPGELTDHYDPTAKVLRLSEGVYNSRSLAAVGIAAHEAGHAIQDALHYAPLVIRNLAVPVANFGSSCAMMLFFFGLMLSMKPLVWFGIFAFAGVVIFQLVNLPVEFDASARAKQQLVELGVINRDELTHVKSVLNAAALTYVAATLQSVLTLLYLVMRAGGNSRDE